LVATGISACLVGGYTLAHEIGHFYGLPHTHEVFSGEELVDGSNCLTAGDGFCDTPADPDLSGFVSRTCNYTGSFRDRNGDTYMPDVSNIMSYSDPSCQNKFSLDQLALVRAVHENENSFVLESCNIYPDFKATSNSNSSKLRFDELISIEYEFENIGIQEDYEVPVFIYLSDKAGQIGSIVKRDTINFFSLASNEPKTYNFKLPSNSGKKQFITLSIDPNSEFIETKKRNNLITDEFIVDNSSLENVLIFPNPSSGVVKLFLRDSNLSGQVTISLYDLGGRLHKTINSFKTNQEFFTELDLSDLREGLYLIEANFEKSDEQMIFKVYKQ